MAKELLTLQNLAKYYTSAQSVVVGLNQLNLTFCRGEFVAVTGESGSGKSTMAHVLGGILPYEGGELLYKGKPTSHYDSADWERYRRDCVSFISQSYGILPGSSVMDNVTCALRLVGFSKVQAQKDAEEILKKVELWDLRRRRAAKLSSGQKQRLSIARALAKPAPVLIADEPTGNLDAENSAMVIELLAEAAKDRLVILITHEFSEAEDYVTRRIELHDGVVTMDAQLREAPELPATRPEDKHGAAGEKKRLSWFVSQFQIKARPVWAVLMLCLFAFTVFAMFATSGTFISNLDDTFTYYYDNSAFRNGDSKRIVVARPDGGEFTQEDVEKILSVKYVDSVEEWGYVTDIQYAYREGVDYGIRYLLEREDGSSGPADGNSFDATYVTTPQYSLDKTQQYMPFARTIPTMEAGKEFLTAGRLPENLYEVVAVGGEELLGQEITVLLRDQKNWGVASVFISMEVTVVGVTDYGSHLYFHEDLGRMMVMNARKDLRVLYMPLPENSVIVGSERIRTYVNGTRYVGYGAAYKLIEGTLARGDEVEATIRQQAYENILDNIEYTEKFMTNFSLEGVSMSELHSNLWSLSSHAMMFGLGTQLEEALEELGLAGDSYWEMDYYERQGIITTTLWDQEIREQLASIAAPLFEQVKEAFEREKKDFMELDFSRLTMEEIEALHIKWFCGVLQEKSHVIQPGEVVVSPTLLSNSLVNALRMTELKTDEDWTRMYEQADFITNAFPNLGQMNALTDPIAYKDLTIISDTDVNYTQVVFLHPDDFAALTYPGKGGQLSVFTEDYAYVDRVLDGIHALGYGAISPYQEGAVKQNEELAEQRLQTLRVCLIALLAVIVLQILLLRAMFSMETESYRLLSHIGLDCVTAQRSVFWQIMLFALGGQVLGVGAIMACVTGGMEQMIHILRYLPLSYRLVLCVVHLCACAFTAVWTMKALKKQVFPESGAEPDLDWDSIGEEVEA